MDFHSELNYRTLSTQLKQCILIQKGHCIELDMITCRSLALKLLIGIAVTDLLLK